MKKARTLPFLLLAGIAMLVCVVICHYHHDEPHVCLITAHYSDCEEAHEHSHDFGCRQCDYGGRTEECLLEAYIIPVRQRLPVDPSLDNDIHPALFSVNSLAETTRPEGLSLKIEPRPLTDHTDYISDSFGSRAPPRI